MVRISGNYGTHLLPLIACVEKTSGPILELGLGWFSTPYLHYRSVLDGRYVLSVDNDKGWVKRFATSDFAAYHYQNAKHKFGYTKNWEDFLISPPNDYDLWAVVLVDHSPSERRIEEVKRLANLAEYIIIHDSNEKFEKDYHYSKIYPLFKYKRVWDGDQRHATVLSNFHDLKDLWWTML